MRIRTEEGGLREWEMNLYWKAEKTFSVIRC